MSIEDEDLTIQMERAGFEAPGKTAFFLAKAREAEEAAIKSTTSEERAQFLKIAEGYRNLAEHFGKSAP